MVADAIRMPRILGAHPTPSESIWIRLDQIGPIPKLKSLIFVSDFAQTHCRTLIVLESRWVKVPCVLLFVYLSGGNGETTLDSQSGFSLPSKGGGSPQSLGPHSQWLSPGTVNQQQQQAAAAATAAQPPPRPWALSLLGVCNNRVSELCC